jgi:hypothetical protein
MAEFLSFYGITPQQYREMDARDSHFLLSAFSEKNKRANNLQRSEMAKMKANRR